MIFPPLDTRMHLLGVTGLLFLLVSVTSAAGAGTTEYFPSDYVWNYPVDNLPVHQFSSHWLADIKAHDIVYRAGTTAPVPQPSPTPLSLAAPVLDLTLAPTGELYFYTFVHLSDLHVSDSQANKVNNTFSTIESFKRQYNISAVFVTGDVVNYMDHPNEWQNYLNARSHTTIPVYEIPGNHDLGNSVYPTADNFTMWDRYIPDGASKHNYGFVFNDFVAYGMGWEHENTLLPATKAGMMAALAANPTKKPLIFTHNYADVNYIYSNMGMGIKGALLRSSNVLYGHQQGDTYRTITYNGSRLTEDLINYQLSGKPMGRFYTVTTDGTTIQNINILTVSFENPPAYPSGTLSADFVADKTTMRVPATIQFTDTSTGGPAAWLWDFGDGGTSAIRNPSHTYSAAGTYTVTLTISNDEESSTRYMTNLITVTVPTPTPLPTQIPTPAPTQTATPAITITSPNGGENWKRGTTQTITWNYAGSPGPTVKIVLLKGSKAVGTINDHAALGSGGKGSYSWPLALTGTGGTGSDYKVSVQSVSQPAIQDISNSYFTIAPATTTPTITVTSPNGGETWKRGTTQTVTWSYTGSPGSAVKLVLLKGSTQVGTIASSFPIGSGGKGSYTWPLSVSGSGGTGSDYRVSVQSISQPAIKDTSNSYFTITSGTTTPTITVTTPNGGETWKRGTSHTVTWSYTGNPGSAVKLVLLKGSTEVGTIASSVPIGSGGKGSYSWPIALSGSGGTGSDYKVSVQSISQPTIQDTSNNYFTISPVTATVSGSVGTGGNSTITIQSTG